MAGVERGEGAYIERGSAALGPADLRFAAVYRHPIGAALTGHHVVAHADREARVEVLGVAACFERGRNVHHAQHPVMVEAHRVVAIREELKPGVIHAAIPSHLIRQRLVTSEKRQHVAVSSRAARRHVAHAEVETERSALVAIEHVGLDALSVGEDVTVGGATFLGSAGALPHIGPPIHPSVAVAGERGVDGANLALVRRFVGAHSQARLVDGHVAPLHRVAPDPSRDLVAGAAIQRNARRIERGQRHALAALLAQHAAHQLTGGSAAAHARRHDDTGDAHGRHALAPKVLAHGDEDQPSVHVVAVADHPKVVVPGLLQPLRGSVHREPEREREHRAQGLEICGAGASVAQRHAPGIPY